MHRLALWFAACLILAAFTGAAQAQQTTTTSSNNHNARVTNLTPEQLAKANQNVIRDQSSAASRNVATMLSTRIANILAPVPGAAPQSVGAVELAGEKTIALDSGKRGSVGKFEETNKGLSAGDAARNMGVWLNAATSIIGSTRDKQDFHGSTWSGLLGFDFKPIERLVFGVIGGLEYNYTMPHFIRETTGRNTYGFSLGPYAAADVFKNTIIDAAAVFTFLSNNYNQADDYDRFPAFRTLFTSNLSQYVMFGDLKLKASGGVMYSDTHVYSEIYPGVGVLDLKIGGEAGYTFFGKLEPYIAAYYIYDALAPGSVDPDEIEALAGVNYSPLDALKLSVECANSFFREHSQNTRIMLNVRYEF